MGLVGTGIRFSEETGPLTLCSKPSDSQIQRKLENSVMPYQQRYSRHGVRTLLGVIPSFTRMIRIPMRSSSACNPTGLRANIWRSRDHGEMERFRQSTFFRAVRCGICGRLKGLTDGRARQCAHQRTVGDCHALLFSGRGRLKHFMRMRQVEAEAPNLPYRQLFSNTDFN
jgi:hypothetical protein